MSAEGLRTSELMGLDSLDQGQVLRRPADLMDLSGRTAAVTGAGGKGLGQATAHRLAAQGASVAVIDLDLDGAKRVADEVEERWGATAVPLQADVADWEQAHAVARTVAERLGSIDIWVNSAGGAGVVAKPYAELGQDDIDRVIRSTLLSTMYGTRAVLQVMIPQGRGRIINVSSEASKMGQNLASVYGTCKSAINGFTRNLAHELPEHGISIVAICPGYMVNEDLRYVIDHPDEFPDMVRLLVDPFQRVLLKRTALPEEIANTIAFLASDAGAYAHGTAISIGGGMSD